MKKNGYIYIYIEEKEALSSETIKLAMKCVCRNQLCLVGGCFVLQINICPLKQQMFSCVCGQWVQVGTAQMFQVKG